MGIEKLEGVGVTDEMVRKWEKIAPISPSLSHMETQYSVTTVPFTLHSLAMRCNFDHRPSLSACEATNQWRITHPTHPCTNSEFPMNLSRIRALRNAFLISNLYALHDDRIGDVYARLPLLSAFKYGKMPHFINIYFLLIVKTRCCLKACAPVQPPQEW